MFEILEIIGGFIFFAVIGGLGLILIPSLLGCFGFILFWVIVLGLIVFFSVNFVWIALLAVVLYAVMAVRKFIRYSALPDYDTYLSDNLNVYHDGKVHCKHCGSDQIVQLGLHGLKSRSRYFMCLRCRQWLYKFKVI